ncbi:hypothetical protein QAD02_023394 [Eretmocerus hayati]|uniref:Uncharacterized protein n=1 Tax=Eretmocerus hayati TaxID=131215 RepID=A0ACC2Q0L2_9HYME|nr:hypothetical protein QAD02_023394 [Eretmocerus hayati]
MENIVISRHNFAIVVLATCFHMSRAQSMLAELKLRSSMFCEFDYEAPWMPNTPSTIRAGICVNLNECNYLLDMIRREPRAIRIIVNNSLCFRNQPRNHLVCCPQFKDNKNETVKDQEKKPSTISPKPRPSTKYTIEGVNKPTQSPPLSQIFSNCGLKGNKIIDRIVGGTRSLPGAWPWIANLGYSTNGNQIKFRCAGSLISSQHVLTAAHCVHNRDDLKIVRLGEYDLSSDDDGAHPVNMTIDKKIIHSEYKPGSTQNDIAILKLGGIVEFTDDIRPICLPEAGSFKSQEIIGTSPFVAGWGSSHFYGSPSTILQETDVTVIDTDKCKESYKSIKGAVIDDRIICAGGTTKDSCQGDSGGPLMTRQNHSFYLIGIVSTGYRCAEPGYPGIYTRVTSHLNFVKSNMD